jgi:hypothetical protein
MYTNSRPVSSAHVYLSVSNVINSHARGRKHRWVEVEQSSFCIDAVTVCRVVQSTAFGAKDAKTHEDIGKGKGKRWLVLHIHFHPTTYLSAELKLSGTLVEPRISDTRF